VLDWMIHDWEFLGFHGQIWMPVFAAGLALYIAVLVVMRHYNTHQH
jgi:hypothetical protein